MKTNKLNKNIKLIKNIDMEETFEKWVKPFGGTGHMLMPKRHVGKRATIIIHRDEELIQEQDPRHKPFDKKAQDKLDENWNEEKSDGYFKALKKLK